MTERRSWRFLDGALLACLVALAVAATWSIWVTIFRMALRDEEQSHILLAPAVAAWLFWVRRERARLCRPARSLIGPAMILGGWVLSWYGFTYAFEAGHHFGALLIVVGAALTILGPDFLLRFFPAFVSLAFMMPIPGRIRSALAHPLQEYSALLTQWGMDLFGQSVVRSGNVLSLNGQDVAVAEACNGMRMVSALGLVAFAFVFSFPMRNWVRVLILAISPVVALVCNVVRLAPTVLLYGYSSKSVADIFHDASGWAVLAVALAILWGVLRTLRWLEFPIEPYAAAKAVR